MALARSPHTTWLWMRSGLTAIGFIEDVPSNMTGVSMRRVHSSQKKIARCTLGRDANVYEPRSHVMLGRRILRDHSTMTDGTKAPGPGNGSSGKQGHPAC
eukprot:5563176-Amphidinium_carterae.4